MVAGRIAVPGSPASSGSVGGAHAATQPASVPKTVYRAGAPPSTAPPSSAVGVLALDRRCSGDRGLRGGTGPDSTLPAGPRPAQRRGSAGGRMAEAGKHSVARGCAGDGCWALVTRWQSWCWSLLEAAALAPHERRFRVADCRSHRRCRCCGCSRAGGQGSGQPYVSSAGPANRGGLPCCCHCCPCAAYCFLLCCLHAPTCFF